MQEFQEPLVFFAQGDNFEAARENLHDVIEGNVLLALQLGLEIPKIEGVEVEEKEYAETNSNKINALRRSQKKRAK